MSNHPFRWMPSLQHMSTVKTIEVLWKHIENKDAIKALLLQFLKYSWIQDSPQRIHRAAVNHLATAIDKLQLPTSVKNRLKSFLDPMVAEAIWWFKYHAEEFNAALTPPTADAINHFVEIQWNNLGIIDSKSMLASYTASKQTINFELWNLLCDYCLEDEILRFARTLDWDNCRSLKSYYSIYWYRKTCRLFPSRKMLRQPSDYNNFKWARDAGLFGRMNCPTTLLTCQDTDEVNFGTGSYLFPSNESAMSFIRNRVMSDEVFKEFVALWSRDELDRCRLGVKIYLLRSMERAECIAALSAKNDILYYLVVGTPLAFIDDWICVLESADVDCFRGYFAHMQKIVIRSEEIARTMLYEPFGKIWPVFYRRFHLDRLLVCESVTMILQSEIVGLCRIMFGGFGRQERQRFVDIWSDDDFGDRMKPSREFLQDFFERVLNEDERTFFRERLFGSRR